MKMRSITVMVVSKERDSGAGGRRKFLEELISIQSGKAEVF